MLSKIVLEAASKQFGNPIRSYLKRPEAVLPESTPYEEATRIFLNPDINILFVVDNVTENHLKGVIFRADILATAIAQTDMAKRTVGDVAKRDLVILRTTTSTVGDAVQVFAGNNPSGRPISQIPVMDDENVLVGYIDRDELLRQILPQ